MFSGRTQRRYIVPTPERGIEIINLNKYLK